MTIEVVLGGAIVLLLGVIIGGAGGQAILRKQFGFPDPASRGDAGNFDNAAVISEAAAEAAGKAIERATKTFRDEFSGRIISLESSINDNTSKVKALVAVCGERHTNLDRRMDGVEADVRGALTNCAKCGQG